jgi:hypothetical protein
MVTTVISRNAEAKTGNGSFKFDAATVTNTKMSTSRITAVEKYESFLFTTPPS